ncbi:actin-like ATPase domain-containing protein [Hesseltinella vesiculosa]|uniref:Phosphotransferase n=1 Tax=Hesseltinella vesiculosa TaxID=101127 RepID=A0A1X2GKH0_9FUNG|nr:actin-like ATPase domain-containing protein [Hesseltinella vesiculosa]
MANPNSLTPLARPITGNYGSSHQVNVMEELESMFDISDDQVQVLIQGFMDEMKAGLANGHYDQYRRNDLKMIPSYVTGHPTGNEKGTYLALEISGVDIYVCQVKLKGEGGKLAINQYQYKIPDHLTAGDDIGVLFDYMADCVADFQRRVGTSPTSPGQDVDDLAPRTYSMAISMGFAIRQTGLARGTIVALEHGFEFANAIGCEVVEALHEKFQAKGLAIKIVALANDSVSTLLAHAYQHPSTRIGIVHAAGTNCAYYDKVSNMTGMLAQHEGPEINMQEEMIVNTEWCNFGTRNHLPMTAFDQQLDAESNNHGIHIFEKMTTGMYLGEVVRQVIVYLLDRQFLSFTTDDEDCLIRIPYHFDTSYMYVCEADEDLDTLEDTRVVLEEMCKVGATTLADREIVKKACELVGHRAAHLLGASIASIVRYTFDQGIGPDLEGGFAIAISGDVYKDYPSFHPRVCETLKALIPNDMAARLSVGIVQNSRIVGAAIVAMLSES